MSKLKGDKQRLESEIEELEKKIERMSTMKNQVCYFSLHKIVGIEFSTFTKLKVSVKTKA